MGRGLLSEQLQWSAYGRLAFNYSRLHQPCRTWRLLDLVAGATERPFGFPRQLQKRSTTSLCRLSRREDTDTLNLSEHLSMSAPVFAPKWRRIYKMSGQI